MTLKDIPDRPNCPHCGTPMATWTSEYWRCRKCREKQRREIAPERQRMLLEKNRERYRRSKEGVPTSASCISNSAVWYKCLSAPEDGLYRPGQYYRSEVVLTDKRERVGHGKFQRPDGKVVQW